MPPVISVVGKSKSGKTTLIEKLIKELKIRGYKIGVIKHSHHGFDIDREGKDSWRHQQAGADTVIVSSKDKIAMTKMESFAGIDSLSLYFQDMDIVITEGYKRENKPKIEVFRSTQHKEPLCLNRNELIAFVSDVNMDFGVPVFGLDEVEKIADFIEKKFLSRNL